MSHLKLVAGTQVAGGESALIVEDSVVQRAHAVQVCRELGIARVYEASNGLEALAMLETVSPAMLIMDLEMPTMDGPALLGRLHTRGLRIPVIVISGRESALVQSVRHLGAALGFPILGAVQKPLTPKALQPLLEQLKNGDCHRQMQPPSVPIDSTDLRTALAGDQITVHYQPQIEISTLAMHGVEALARWPHPTLGMIPPDRFIPLAEQHGLIHELTLRVLNLAMAQALHWSAREIHCRVAVNLSPVLLERPGLVEEIAGLQQSYGIPAQRMVIEVTESSLMRDPALALSALTRMRLRGFGLSLDDYGTGFSSMQQLARIPFTELKIDRSFVQGAAQRTDMQIILRRTIEMASELGVTTVAEGVSTEEELRLLREFGCGYAQGWLIAKALPGADLEGWLAAYEARQRAMRACL